jgi:hypothetical protein
MMGLWDNAAQHGPITGSGPGFAEAMRKFGIRQEKERKRGIWRKAPAKWKTNDGTRIDPEWYIIDYGQGD